MRYVLAFMLAALLASSQLPEAPDGCRYIFVNGQIYLVCE